MPPLLTARTCWRAGWLVLGLGVVLLVASTPIATVFFDGQGPGLLGGILYSVLSAVTYTTLPAGTMLLVGSLVLRHVERLTDALVSSGTIQALPTPSRGVERATDGDVDLDADVVEHGPGAR